MRVEVLRGGSSSGIVFLHDLLMVVFAWLGAYYLRFNLRAIPDGDWSMAITLLPFVIVSQVIVLRVLGLYKGVWRFASIPDLIRIIKAVIYGSLLIAFVLFLYNRLQGVPRSVIPLYVILLLLLLSVPRFLYRFWRDSVQASLSGRRALIVGAGCAGEMLVRDLSRSPSHEYIPVVFVDDDKNKRKREIRGIHVAGSIRKIPRFIKQYQIEKILIAVPSATDKEMQRIVEICEGSGVPFLTLPSVSEILSRRVSADVLREVSIDDLLGRESVKPQWDHVTEMLAHKSILVTGGGGSIGSELCRQLANLSPNELVVFEKSEFNLYKIDAELRSKYPELSIQSILGDVADRGAVDHVMARFKPDFVFHAAAYKHVPLLETQAREAVHNNVIGTKNVAEASIEAGVGHFVLISTDKAVNPTNIMGATKRAAEIFCQSCSSRSETDFTTVRFGNVLGSAGSVVPLFQEQIKQGGPVTVTDPEMTRYFMTIPEACQLIMEAASVGSTGKIFVLDMGEPIKISYLAEQMIRLSGKRVGEDIEIKYIGLRPGEKLYEELFHGEEALQPSGHDKLFFASARGYEEKWVNRLLQKLEEACRAFDEDRIKETIREFVPEYQEDKMGHSCGDEAREAVILADRRKFQRTS